MFRTLWRKLVPNLHARQVKPILLVILDGWGIAPPSAGNVTVQARLPHLQKYLKTFPNTQLIASGESVGLPANEVGNTEVGHLTLGAGRVVYQGLKRINTAIQDGSFFQNRAFHQAIAHVRTNNSQLHLIGIVSSGNVHGSLEHFKALLELCRLESAKNVFLHVFTDGRDAPPQEAVQIIDKLTQYMREANLGRIATISGRYYAMDRDRRWDRVQKAYEAIVEGKGPRFTSCDDAIHAAYDAKLSDELIEPSVICVNDQPIATLNDNDAFIFTNFRIDRPRELTMALTIPDFEHLRDADFGYSSQEKNKPETASITSITFNREKFPKNVFSVTMTKYHENIPVSAVAFGIDPIAQPLSQVLAEKQLHQLHMAESEKERFVTYYFDGYREQLFPGEEVTIAASPKVASYDKKPAMSIFRQLDEFRKRLHQDRYHFFVMNIANPDMVAHTGNIKATIKALETTDRAVGELVEEVLAADGTIFITADHGNAEELLTYPTTSFFFTSDSGSMNTDHSNNPVHFIVVNRAFAVGAPTFKMESGTLSDVAPTILTYMGLPVPSVMTGRNLLRPVEPKTGSPK